MATLVHGATKAITFECHEFRMATPIKVKSKEPGRIELDWHGDFGSRALEPFGKCTVAHTRGSASLLGRTCDSSSWLRVRFTSWPDTSL